MTEKLGSQVAAGAVWMIGLRVAITVLGFGSTLVLARVLVPADFGLVALGTAMVAALDLLTSFRFDLPLIQNQSATRHDYDTAWTLNVILGTGLAAMLCLAAVPASNFYEEPRLSGVIYFLAAGTFVDGLVNIGVVNFRKELMFDREFLYSLIRKLAGVLIAVTIAVRYRSYWALVAGILATSVVGVLASYLMHPYRPRLSLNSVRSLFHFSKWLILDNVLFFLRHRSAHFLIGKTAGTAQLGLFSLGYELATLANSNLAAPIDRAVFPGYARVSDDTDALRDGYLAVIGMTALLAIPIALGTAAIAPLAVPVLFGSKWLGSIPLVQVLSFGASISLLGSGAGIVCLSMGRPHLLAWQSAVYVTALLSGLALLLPSFGLGGAVWAFVVAAAVNLPVQLVVLKLLLGRVVGLWVGTVWRPLVSAALMYIVVTSVLSVTEQSPVIGFQVIQLLCAAGAGAIIYIALVIAFWWLVGRPKGAEHTLLTQVRRLARKADQPWLRI